MIMQEMVLTYTFWKEQILNEDGTINVDTLGEAISEVFRKYMNGEKISQEAQELIERTIRWAWKMISWKSRHMKSMIKKESYSKT